jgi:DNA-binding transcriptional LysR family regulator
MHNRLEVLRLFIAATEGPSFRAAAARCEVSPQVITRAVQALEAEVGETLFHRNTRRIQLSEAGERLAVRARDALETVNGLFTSEAARDNPFEGIVRVAAPTLHGRRWVVPALAQLSLRHPGLQFDLRLSDEVIDPVMERIDVGLRGGRVANSRIVARRVTAVEQVICASPQLIKACGGIRSLADLERVPTTQLLDTRSGKPWAWQLRGGAVFESRKVAFVTNDPLAEIEAVVRGLGVGQVARIEAAPYLQDGRLVEPLSDAGSDEWSLFVYRVRRSPVSARVQLTFRALVDAFRQAHK